MATHRQSKNEAFKPYMLLLLLAAPIILILCIFFDRMTISNRNQIVLPPNFKLIHNDSPIKIVSNNNQQKIGEIIKLEEAFKIPAKFIKGNNEGKVVTFEKIDPKSENCPINAELLEMNRKLLD